RTRPFEPAFTGGVFVAAGDIDGDGKAEVVISPDQGGGPRVRVFHGGDLGVMADFLGIDDLNFRGGTRVAVGGVNADGRGGLAVNLLANSFGGDPASRGGVRVAVAAEPGSGARVLVMVDVALAQARGVRLDGTEVGGPWVGAGPVGFVAGTGGEAGAPPVAR